MNHSEFIRETSGNKTVIVFIHGILGTPNHFDDMILKVPSNCSIFNVLLDGHGGSVDDFAKATMSDWKKQVKLILSKLCDKYDNVIITAHSMGALFAIRAAVNNPKVKALFLLAVPLKLLVKPIAIMTSLKVLFDKTDDNNPQVIAARKAYGIIPDKRLWKYVRWIPNYFSLFIEIRAIRKITMQIAVPCSIFQSRKDELVSGASIKYFDNIRQIECTVLNESSHFYYDEKDYSHLLYEFERFCEKYII